LIERRLIDLRVPKAPSRGSDHENQSHDFKVKWRSDHGGWRYWDCAWCGDGEVIQAIRRVHKTSCAVYAAAWI